MEGRILAIGVSNWDVPLMNELSQFATVPPHSVEQLMNIVDRDNGMMRLALAQNIAFTAYGSLRNMYDTYFRKELMEREEREVILRILRVDLTQPL